MPAVNRPVWDDSRIGEQGVFPKGDAPFLLKEVVMYSPKIEETLIPCLYHAAKARRMPMTRLVAQLIRKALSAETLPEEAKQALAAASANKYVVVMEVKTTAA